MCACVRERCTFYFQQTNTKFSKAKSYARAHTNVLLDFVAHLEAASFLRSSLSCCRRFSIVTSKGAYTSLAMSIPLFLPPAFEERILRVFAGVAGADLE